MTAIKSNMNPANLPFVEELYEKFLRDASSVSPEWREYFSQVAG
jgi:2-oxoglutarate dehydrogenase complex dehydrogenase (E1) component-like enzyme